MRATTTTAAPLLLFLLPSLLWASPLLSSSTKLEHFIIHFPITEQTQTGEEKSVQTNESSSDVINERPIIGILAQELPPSLSGLYPNKSSYISASYVKFVEAGGARVVPVHINQPDEYYQFIFNSTNGLLLPGGAVSVVTSGYAYAATQIWNLAQASDDHFPIWGTCLGFEMIAVLANEGRFNLHRCQSADQSASIRFSGQWNASRMAEDMPQEVHDILEHGMVCSKTQYHLCVHTSSLVEPNVTINFHHWCLPAQNLSQSQDKSLLPLATTISQDGLEFVSLLEAKDQPVWGSQFHPEKLAWEWSPKEPNIPRSRKAIKAAGYFADFFVSQARKSHHSFPDRKREEMHLIYNNDAYYIGKEGIDFTMQQVYMY